MRILLTTLLLILAGCFWSTASFAQYGEHGKPRMLLIQTHSDFTPPADEETELIRTAIGQSNIAAEVKQEDFMSARLSYTVFINRITPIAMEDHYYNDLKERLKKLFPKATFQEVEFEAAYKLLGKSYR